MERYENDGYTADGSSVSVQVASDKDDVDIKVQNVMQSWEVEQQQQVRVI